MNGNSSRQFKTKNSINKIKSFGNILFQFLKRKHEKIRHKQTQLLTWLLSYDEFFKFTLGLTKMFGIKSNLKQKKFFNR